MQSVVGALKHILTCLLMCLFYRICKLIKDQIQSI